MISDANNYVVFVAIKKIEAWFMQRGCPYENFREKRQFHTDHNRSVVDLKEKNTSQICSYILNSAAAFLEQVGAKPTTKVASNKVAASHWPLFRQDIKYGDKGARFSTPCLVPLHGCTSVRCTPLAIRNGVTHLEVSSAITGLSLELG
ncbi:hypothetical protein CDAR_67321 [Caerostris darwini]|uniref:Uncharacterized protein n=1 Tax=Caerostris darwini TaxID=1538125 RepID=A0AAV4S3Y2_9ARAC|nr:hypothetical protein CDAR_67321 [Caerostris darwini]